VQKIISLTGTPRIDVNVPGARVTIASGMSKGKVGIEIVGQGSDRIDLTTLENLIRIRQKPVTPQATIEAFGGVFNITGSVGSIGNLGTQGNVAGTVEGDMICVGGTPSSDTTGHLKITVVVAEGVVPDVVSAKGMTFENETEVNWV